LGVRIRETARFRPLPGIDTRRLRGLRHIAGISLPATVFGVLDRLLYGASPPRGTTTITTRGQSHEFFASLLQGPHEVGGVLRASLTVEEV